MHHRDMISGPGAADGISEVVGFVFILAVVVAGLSLYLVYGVPVLGREGEITEMDGVRAWFIDYKAGVDQLWLNSPLVQNSSAPSPSRPMVIYPAEDRLSLFNTTIGMVTLRTVINAGAIHEKGFVQRYLPVFSPIPASAEVSIRNGTTESLTITGSRGGSEVFQRTFSAPALTYTSHNNYYLQQEYYYQLGGVFLRQWGREGGSGAGNTTVVASPPFSIYNPEGGTGYRTTVGLMLVNLNAPGGGFGATSPVRVETRLDEDPVRLDTGGGGDEFSGVNVTFNAASAEAAQAWKKAFTGAALRNGGTGVMEGTHFHITRPSTDSDTVATVNITGFNTDDPNTRDVLLEVLVANYSARLENVPTIIE